MEANSVKILFQGFYSAATENSKLDQTCMFQLVKKNSEFSQQEFRLPVHMLCHLATGDSCKVGPIVNNKIIYFFVYCYLRK